jgi:hypothetical protein
VTFLHLCFPCIIGGSLEKKGQDEREKETWFTLRHRLKHLAGLAYLKPTGQIIGWKEGQGSVFCVAVLSQISLLGPSVFAFKAFN